MIASLAEADLPPTHLQAELDKYSQIEKDTSSIGKAASSWINWDKASIFLVGDIEAIKKAIAAEEDLKLGDIVEVDNEGNVIH